MRGTDSPEYVQEPALSDSNEDEDDFSTEWLDKSIEASRHVSSVDQGLGSHRVPWHQKLVINCTKIYV